MNPILLKTLMSLASSNASGTPRAAGGMDANLRSRTVLYPDEPVGLPRWGISALPSMILGAAPQTCLFVNDLSVGPASTDQREGSDSTSDHDDADQASETVSFSLALDSPPDKTSGLTARKITWQLSMPIAGYRDIKTSANSASVRAPVIRTRMQLRGIDRDVEIGLLEMAGLEQPLLIGQDTLGDQFLIRPDRAKDEKPATPPSANLAANTPEAASDDKDKSAPKDAVPQNGDTTPSTPTTPTDVAPVTPPASDAQPPSDTSTDTKNADSAVTASTPDAATPTADSQTPATPATPAPTPSADAANAPQGAPASDPAQATTEHATETPPSPAPQTDTTSTEANTSNTPSTQPTAPVTPPAPSETQPEPKPENT